MSKHNIKAIIWDAGNVLVRFDHLKACTKLAKYCAFSPDEILNIISLGDNSPFFHHEDGRLSPLEFFLTTKKLLGLEENLSFEEFSNIWGDIFEENTELSGVLSKISPDVKMCILSNTNPMHWAFVEKLSLLKNHFPNKELIILSYNSLTRKPDTKIYNDALSVLNITKENIGSVLYFDDVENYREAFKTMGGNAVEYNCSTEPISALENALKEYGVI